MAAGARTDAREFGDRFDGVCSGGLSPAPGTRPDDAPLMNMARHAPDADRLGLGGGKTCGIGLGGVATTTERIRLHGVGVLKHRIEPSVPMHAASPFAGDLDMAPLTRLVLGGESEAVRPSLRRGMRQSRNRVVVPRRGVRDGEREPRSNRADRRDQREDDATAGGARHHPDSTPRRPRFVPSRANRGDASIGRRQWTLGSETSSRSSPPTRKPFGLKVCAADGNDRAATSST